MDPRLIPIQKNLSSCTCEGTTYNLLYNYMYILRTYIYIHILHIYIYMCVCHIELVNLNPHMCP